MKNESLRIIIPGMEIIPAMQGSFEHGAGAGRGAITLANGAVVVGESGGVREGAFSLPPPHLNTPPQHPTSS